MVRKWAVLGTFLFSFALHLSGQEEEVPPILFTRAEESYLFLSEDVPNQVFLQPLKLVPLNQSRNIFLTIGGEYRARFESFNNENYTEENVAYYSQRLDLHLSLRFGSNIRFFGELYHGYTSGEDRILEDDRIDLHQGFLEIDLLKKETSSLSMRLGRQEMGFGSSRLIGIREGPNMRRAFDLAKITYERNGGSYHLIYGKELTYGFAPFDNRSNFFEANTQNPTIWGIHLQNQFIGKPGHLDFYYLGFQSNTSGFNDVTGKETRHSIGIRSYGKSGKFSYNTELIYQWGTLGESNISAYNFETDWKYELISSGWKPTLGLRLDLSSGDAKVGDNQVQTFNPMFVNPAIYSLAAVNTPANLTSFHPNLTAYPISGFSVYMDFAVFYRTRIEDGLYTPPRFLVREAMSTEEKHIGNVIGLQASWEVNRNLSFDLRSSYFMAGAFLEVTGDSENTFHIAPTLSLRF